MVQWLRICLEMQGTLIQSLLQRISHAAEQLSPRTATEACTLCNKRSQPKRPVRCNQRRPCTTQHKKINLKKYYRKGRKEESKKINYKKIKDV